MKMLFCCGAYVGSWHMASFRCDGISSLPGYSGLLKLAPMKLDL
jgi:hypothetical protein